MPVAYARLLAESGKRDRHGKGGQKKESVQ